MILFRVLAAVAMIAVVSASLAPAPAHAGDPIVKHGPP